MDALVGFLVRLLELLFAVGWIGSLLVIILSGIEDVETVFEGSPTPEASAEPNPPPSSPPL